MKQHSVLIVVGISSLLVCAAIAQKHEANRLAESPDGTFVSKAIPGSLDSEARAAKKRLSRLHGAAFDRAYMEDMVKDHQEDIAEFQKEAGGGSDTDVKAFASKTLPTLQHHLKMAQDGLAEVSK